MGEKALHLSTRTDRSRDPLYNQSKAYSELFRMLGWIRSETNDRLKFRFTYLGAHIAEARRDADALMRECILGIAVPNDLVNSKGDMQLRPFACILRTLGALDGLACRDELIVGPLSLENDRTTAFDKMITELRSIRGDTERLDAAIASLEKTRGITSTTMGNYTRFPLAVLDWSGWTKRSRQSAIYGRSIMFQELTDEGRAEVARLSSLTDLRAADLSALSDESLASIARVAMYKMLHRSGFDISPVKLLLDEAHAVCQADAQLSSVDVDACLFSPFQELPVAKVESYFPVIQQTTEDATTERAIGLARHLETEGTPTGEVKAVVLRPVRDAAVATPTKDTALAQQLRETADVYGEDRISASSQFAEQFVGANQNEFYPLVAGLFRLAGFSCEHSRAGVNYQRSDAFIADASYSMPIEIKSPGEEMHLSVKAIRQALENKIILLARKSHPTAYETTSLAIGFELPNDRAEVCDLIDNIHEAFGIRIGVVDIRTLIELAMRAVVDDARVGIEKLGQLKGIISLERA